MAQTVIKLPTRTSELLQRSCQQGGFGSFLLRWRRSQDETRFTIESAPSLSFKASRKEVESSIGAFRDTRLTSPLTISDVNEYLMRMLWRQWNSKSESGSISINCRRQANGKVRVAMSFSVQHRDLVITATETTDLSEEVA